MYGGVIAGGMISGGFIAPRNHTTVEKQQNGKQIPNNDLKSAPSKRGRAPIGNDGYPVELHHRNQNPVGPMDEMTRTDHRLNGNFQQNHNNNGKSPSDINRTEFNNFRSEYWGRAWDSGRFNNIPGSK